MNIKTIRESSNMTQEELSNSLGISRSTVAMWETGQSVPRLLMLKKIAEALGCKVIDLLEEEE